MNFITSWMRKRAIVRYKKLLPTALANDYGKSEYYLPKQVLSTVERKGLSGKHSHFSLVMFCSNESFSDFQSQGNLDLDYGEGRLIVAQVLFNGASKFAQTDLSVGGSVGETNAGDGIGSDGGAEG